MARPKLQIDETQVENLAAIGCTVSEIAVFMGCSKRTLETRFCALIEKGRERMKISLKRVQYQKAVNDGNVTMLIWLGKQYLGQTDKVEQVKPEDLDAMIERELERIATASR